MTFQTEFEFTLPKGYVDNEGNLHKKGIMRLATAADEILPLKDPRVQANPPYLTVILLSRVIIKLGDLPVIDTKVLKEMSEAQREATNAILDSLFGQMVKTVADGRHLSQEQVVAGHRCGVSLRRGHSEAGPGGWALVQGPGGRRP